MNPCDGLDSLAHLGVRPRPACALLRRWPARMQSPLLCMCHIQPALICYFCRPGRVVEEQEEAMMRQCFRGAIGNAARGVMDARRNVLPVLLYAPGGGY